MSRNTFIQTIKKNMETQANKRAALEMVLSLYDYHTRIFINVLADISDTDAQQRLNSPANHMAWIAGSVVQGRYSLAQLIGGSQMKQTSHELFKDFQGIKDDVAYPSLDEYRKDWAQVSAELREIIAGLSEEQLEGPDPYKMPGGDYTVLDTLYFCTDRESYCIGQLGLWRRLLGYQAMKYD
jgi:hypothetical protein